MADDGDDFVFDEDGIYRERDLDTDQDFLDEDGIWRDDDDDLGLEDKDHLDRYTFRTDSGLGTAERRSSISTLNKAPFGAGRFGGSIDLNYDDDFGDNNHRGSYNIHERSINISDLEASASVVGDYDFERVSIDSNAEVDLPELHHGLTDGSSDGDVGDLNDFDDFGGSRDSAGFNASFNRTSHSRPHQRSPGLFDRSSPRQSAQITPRQRYAHHSDSLEHIHLTKTRSFDNSFDNNTRALHRRASDEQSLTSLTSQPRDQHRGTAQSIAEYLVSGSNHADGDKYARSGSRLSEFERSRLSELECDDEVGQLPQGRRPHRVVDRSLSQEDQDVLSYHQGHSLMEFERLEAAFGGGDSHSEKSGGDQMDLIGAYLQGLQDQEDEEEEQLQRIQEAEKSMPRSERSSRRSSRGHADVVSRRGESLHSGEGQRSMERQRSLEAQRSFESQRSEDRQKLMDRQGSYEGPQSINRQRSIDRQSSNNDEIGYDNHDDSVEFLLSPQPVEQVESHPSAIPRQLSRSDAFEVESPPESAAAQPTQETRTPRTPRQLPSRGSRAGDSFENTATFDDSVSFVENQQPPFDSLSFSTLDMTGGTNEAASRNATINEGNYSSRPSKIPMLRSRSPSMTRPGSTSPNRSRAQTPDRSRGRPRHSEGRTLPKTPSQKSKSQDSMGSLSRRDSSQESRSPQIEPTEDTSERTESRGKDRSRYSDQEESELDKAASLLLGETDPIDLASIAPDPQPMSKSMPDQRTRRNSSASAAGSRPGSARAQRQVGPTSVRQRPSSAEGVRSVSKKDFKARPAASGLLGSQPLRAIGREVEEADRALQEAQQRQLNEETLKQLQQDYNTLLQKYAQAENTIDSLRIGATIPINVELSTTGGGGGGTAVGTTSTTTSTGTGPQALQGAPGVSTIGASTASLNNSLRGKGHGSRPGSGRNSRSNSIQIGASATPTTEQVNLAASLSGEGDKLSLLAKSKAVEEKINALSILLNESCLNTEDQVTALQNVRDGYEQLQQEYRDARANHDYLIRTGEMPHDTPGFDENKALEGDLYKLGMKVDDLEQQVQENVKVKSSARVPFKADHSINVNGMTNPQSDTGDCTGNDLASNRPPSVGSFAGGPEDIDEQLHRLTKDYNQLMDRYRRLKQLKKTPERDLEIDGLLKNLKRIYEETPDHRKPALPPELENHYNPVKDNFMSSESEAPRRGSLAMYSSRGQESDSLPGLNASDLSIGKHSKGRLPDRKNSSDFTDSTATDSTTRMRRQKRFLNRPPLAPASYDSFDSMTSSPSRKSESSTQAKHYTTTPPGGRRREREDKDSGYVGSEASRKAANQGYDKDRLHPGQGMRRSLRSLPRSDRGTGSVSDVTKSTSDLSTVEHIRPHRPLAAQGNRTKDRDAVDGNVSVGANSSGNKSRLRPGHAISDPALSRRSKSRDDVRKTADVTDSDVSSQLSQETGRSKPSVRSEQIQCLADEINKLRDELRHRDSNLPTSAAVTMTTAQPVVTSQQPPIATATTPAVTTQPSAYMYAYPQQEGAGTIPQGTVYYTAQPLAQPIPTPTPGAVMLQPQTVPQYTEPNAPQGVQDYREIYDPRPVEHWEAYDYSRHRDYDDLDRGHSGYHSDDGRRRQSSSKDRDRERRRRLKDYYVPRGGSPVRGHHSHGGEHRQYRRAPPTYGPPPSGVQPPTYQQLQHAATPCGSCRGTGHTAQQTYVAVQPQPLPQQQQQQQGYVLVPASAATVNQQPVQTQQTFIQTSPSVEDEEQSSLSWERSSPRPKAEVKIAPSEVKIVLNLQQEVNTAYVPVQMVEKPTNPKIRYYVREYGGDSDFEGRPMRRSYSVGNLARASKKVKHVILEEAVSDTEGHDGGLNDSLTSALQTASELKVMSRRMKKTLKTELDQSLRSSLRAMAY